MLQPHAPSRQQYAAAPLRVQAKPPLTVALSPLDIDAFDSAEQVHHVVDCFGLCVKAIPLPVDVNGMNRNRTFVVLVAMILLCASLIPPQEAAGKKGGSSGPITAEEVQSRIEALQLAARSGDARAVGEAAETLFRAARMADHPDGLAIAGQAFALLRDPDKAMRAWQGALQIDAVHEPSLLMATQVLVVQRQVDDAVDMLEQARRNEEESFNRRLNLVSRLAELHSLRDEHAAGTGLLEAFLKLPGLTQDERQSGLLRLGQACDRAGEYPRAITLVRGVVVDEGRSDLQAVQYLAALQLKADDLPALIRDFLQAEPAARAALADRPAALRPFDALVGHVRQEVNNRYGPVAIAVVTLRLHPGDTRAENAVARAVLKAIRNPGDTDLDDGAAVAKLLVPREVGTDGRPLAEFDRRMDEGRAEYVALSERETNPARRARLQWTSSEAGARASIANYPTYSAYKVMANSAFQRSDLAAAQHAAAVAVGLAAVAAVDGMPESHYEWGDFAATATGTLAHHHLTTVNRHLDEGLTDREKEFYALARGEPAPDAALATKARLDDMMAYRPSDGGDSFSRDELARTAADRWADVHQPAILADAHRRLAAAIHHDMPDDEAAAATARVYGDVSLNRQLARYDHQFETDHLPSHVRTQLLNAGYVDPWLIDAALAELEKGEAEAPVKTQRRRALLLNLASIDPRGMHHDDDYGSAERRAARSEYDRRSVDAMAKLGAFEGKMPGEQWWALAWVQIRLNEANPSPRGLDLWLTVAAFERVLHVKGGNPSIIRLTLGDQYLRAGEPEVAIDHFRFALDSGEAEKYRPGTLLNLARAQQKAGVDEFFDTFNKAAAAAKQAGNMPLLATAHGLIGNHHRKASDADKALEHYLLAHDAQPERLDVMLAMVEIYMEQKSWDKAEVAAAKLSEAAKAQGNSMMNLRALSYRQDALAHKIEGMFGLE